MLFQGKAAIVTGGSRGIGRAIVLMLAQEGADVAFSYFKSVQDAESLIKEVVGLGRKALGLQIDVRDFTLAKDLIVKAKEKFGRLDILVNNAGIAKDKALMMMTKDEWQEVIDTNLGGTFNATRQAIVTFLKQKSGQIINITSVSGVAGLARQVNYSASKAGIIGFTKSLAKEVAPYGVRVNAVAPGFVETDMIAELKEDYKEQLKEQIPLGRFGRVEDVSAAVKFLLSDAAGFITGQTIIVDGGLFIQ
ncbi:MAG: 3-oxoacyl-[acyl-carrier-protein] reductase [Candidatus Omnitrophota bacterium]